MLSHQPLSELFLVGPMQSQQFGQRLRQHIWGHQGLRAKNTKPTQHAIYICVVTVIIYICIAALDYITLMAPRLIGARGSALEFYIRINLLSRLVHIVFSWLLQSLRLCTYVQICSYTTCSACLHMHVWRDGASAAASNGSTCGLHHGKPTFDTT